MGSRQTDSVTVPACGGASGSTQQRVCGQQKRRQQDRTRAAATAQCKELCRRESEGGAAAHSAGRADSGHVRAGSL